MLLSSIVFPNIILKKRSVDFPQACYSPEVDCISLLFRFLVCLFLGSAKNQLEATGWPTGDSGPCALSQVAPA